MGDAGSSRRRGVRRRPVTSAHGSPCAPRRVGRQLLERAPAHRHAPGNGERKHSNHLEQLARRGTERIQRRVDEQDVR